MYAVTGSTSQIGGAVVRALLAEGRQVRALYRREKNAAGLQALGAEAFQAPIEDSSKMEAAFRGMEGVFLMTPPFLDAPNPRGEHAMALAAIAHAVQASHVPTVVMLSSIGAQLSKGTGTILEQHDMEQTLLPLARASAALRTGRWMESLLPLLDQARETGKLPAGVPVDLALPMVAARDIGAAAARLLLEGREGRRIVELEGPERYAPADAARLFSEKLGRPVTAETLAAEARLALFAAIGCTPGAASGMAEMEDGFSSGLIAFEGGPGGEHEQGQTTLEAWMAGV